MKKIIVFILLAALLACGGYVVYLMVTPSKAPVTEEKQGETAESRIVLANKYIKDGNYEEAILEFKKAIEIDNKNFDAYDGLVRAYVFLDSDDTVAGVIDTVKAYHTVSPEDDRLIETVYGSISLLDLFTEYDILDGIYEIDHNEGVLAKRTEIEDILYEQSQFLPAYEAALKDSLALNGASAQLHYWLNDFDGDDIPELVIGAEYDWNIKGQHINEIYTYRKNAARLVISGDAHTQIYPTKNNGLLQEYAEYLSTEYTLFEIVNGKTVESDALYNYDGEWTYKNNSISENEADGIIKKFEADVIEMPWKRAENFFQNRHELVKEYIIDTGGVYIPEDDDYEIEQETANIDYAALGEKAAAVLQNYNGDWVYAMHYVDNDAYMDIVLYNDNERRCEVWIYGGEDEDYINAGGCPVKYGIYGAPENNGILVLTGGSGVGQYLNYTIVNEKLTENGIKAERYVLGEHNSANSYTIDGQSVSEAKFNEFEQDVYANNLITDFKAPDTDGIEEAFKQFFK